MNIHERIAEALGWTEAETHGFSLATLREFVRVKHPKLAAEISGILQRGDHILEPAPPRRRRR